MSRPATSPGRSRIRPRSSEPPRHARATRRCAKYGGILGLVSMGLALLSPVLGYAIAIPLQSIAALCIV